MSSKKRVLGRMGVVAFTTTLSLTFATAAYAGTDERIDVAGGEVTFAHQGDFLDSYDLKADGYCLTGDLKINAWHEWSITSCGYNTYKYRSLKQINEGAPLYIRACYSKKRSDGSIDRVKCTGWQGAHA
ncbi:hypothetical protein [Streptomyces cavernicola]|uniref:Ricin B lectin domain-containing protein n=1 Tax=Streptomyces cavernicola TaxID=3043613 RepID=A0ABT6S5S6_9ACTN|nr:hypothetical protein [Streptomyces sp. B-S-A6]MDI3403423.1 hypothetical protein [Streptomyces sp. B-S-A6]